MSTNNLLKITKYLSSRKGTQNYLSANSYGSGSVGDWTQGRICAKHVYYHRAPHPAWQQILNSTLHCTIFQGGLGCNSHIPSAVVPWFLNLICFMVCVFVSVGRNLMCIFVIGLLLVFFFFLTVCILNCGYLCRQDDHGCVRHLMWHLWTDMFVNWDITVIKAGIWCLKPRYCITKSSSI